MYEYTLIEKIRHISKILTKKNTSRKNCLDKQIFCYLWIWINFVFLFKKVILP